MKRIIMTLLVLLAMASPVIAHRGRTDSHGGHFVRSPGYGYAVGSYHIHNADGTVTECDPPGSKKYEYVPPSDSSSSSESVSVSHIHTGITPASDSSVDARSNDDPDTGTIVGIFVIVFGFFGIPVIFGIVGHFRKKKERRKASEKIYHPIRRSVNRQYNRHNYYYTGYATSKKTFSPAPSSSVSSDTSCHTGSDTSCFSDPVPKSSPYQHLTSDDRREILEYLNYESQQHSSSEAS